MLEASGMCSARPARSKKQRQPAVSGLLSTSKLRLGYKDNLEATCQLMCRLSRWERRNGDVYHLTPLKASGSSRTDL